MFVGLECRLYQRFMCVCQDSFVMLNANNPPCYLLNFSLKSCTCSPPLLFKSSQKRKRTFVAWYLPRLQFVSLDHPIFQVLFRKPSYRDKVQTLFYLEKLGQLIIDHPWDALLKIMSRKWLSQTSWSLLEIGSKSSLRALLKDTWHFGLKGDKRDLLCVLKGSNYPPSLEAVLLLPAF